MTYDQPNYTQVPNALLDEQMQDMGLAELKCVLLVIRKTFGWHKGRDRISYTQFEKETGLSRESVRQGTTRAVERKVLRQYTTTQGYEYALNVDPYPVPESSTVAVLESSSTKETIQKKNNATRDRLSDMIKQKPNPLTEYPPDVQDLLQAFVDLFERYPLDAEKSGWIKAARNWRALRVTPEHVKAMFLHSRKEGLAITSPFSITYAFDAIRNNSNPLTQSAIDRGAVKEF